MVIFKKIWLFFLQLFGIEKEKGDNVPQGLQVFNEDGSLQLDTTTRASILLGEVILTQNAKSVSFSSQLLVDGTPFYIALKPKDSNRPLAGIEKSLNGNTLTISASSVSASEVKVIIGVY